MSMDLRSTVRLSSNTEIPRFGLGVYRAGRGQATQDAVRWALEAGYRHVDTAHIYRNEQDVGEAIRQSGVPRNEIFVTTKLWNADHGYDDTLRAFDQSLAALQMETVDLYLIHWPVAEKRLDSWRAMEALYESGRAKAIGVSNFVVRHLEELADSAHVMPAVNQIELHPFCQQPETVAWCQAHGVGVEAYSPVTKGQKLDHPVLVQMGKALNKSPAQVLIRWALQKDFITIPKSENQARIQENAAVFDFALSPAHMARLDALEEDLHLAWDPTDVP